MAYRDEVKAQRDKDSRDRSVDLTNLAARAEFKKASFGYDSLAQAFPPADPHLIPFGSDVLVQIRTPRTRSRGGLYLPEETRETDLWNMQVAKVIAFGPVAFRNRDTMQPWPECVDGHGDFFPWAGVGDYVRVPKYGGDRMWVDAESPDAKALFVLFNDLDLKGRVPEEYVLDMVAYI